ncbi:signal-induced proliferation-associated 1-like protein 1 [Macrobrachium nipponense]|uniref:signal-induced proliferation-associated 1-like protein 1 n=1 Tax=Macrobrachium nipponense TaxID=159736 RepID=UPI0030C81FD0
MGPVAISIRKEKLEDVTDNAHSLPTYQYRIIIRTAELYSCQGTVLEESLGRPSGEKGRGSGSRELLEYVCPQLSVGSLRLGQATPQTEEALLRLDDLGIHNKFKIGVLYCRAGQTTEEEMYNNESAGPAFSEFLEILGQRVRLKDFDKYRGGLDRKMMNVRQSGFNTNYVQYLKKVNIVEWIDEAATFQFSPPRLTEGYQRKISILQSKSNKN